MVGTPSTTPAPSVTFLPQLLSRTSLRRLPPNTHTHTQQPSPHLPRLWAWTLFAGRVIPVIGAQYVQHLHYFSSLHSRKTICTPPLPPQLHAVAPANHVCSAAHCLLAVILPVITLLRSRIQSKPAAARSADHHILPFSGANVFLLPSLW